MWALGATRNLAPQPSGVCLGIGQAQSSPDTAAIVWLLDSNSLRVGPAFAQVKPAMIGSTLDHLDEIYLRAAEGWVELGDLDEGIAELDRITGASRAHPSVLHLRWRISAAFPDWDKCLELSRQLAEGYPDDPQSWITLAETFYATGDPKRAYRTLAQKAAIFPESWRLFYDAACYACLIGKFRTAERFFQRALHARAALNALRQASRRSTPHPSAKFGLTRHFVPRGE